MKKVVRRIEKKVRGDSVLLRHLSSLSFEAERVWILS